MLLVVFASCSSETVDEKTESSNVEIVIADTLKIPTTGQTILLAHSEVENEILALNLARASVLFYNYEAEKLVDEFQFKNSPDVDPGIFYSAGYYQNGFYVLGSNGLFFYNRERELTKSLKSKSAQYSESGPVHSYIIHHNNEDFLVCKLKSPQETLKIEAKPGSKEYLKALRFITVIPIDREEFSYYLLGEYSDESNVLNNEGKLPRRSVLFAVKDESIQILFGTEPKSWEHQFAEENTVPTKSHTLDLDHQENRYLLPADQFDNQHDFLRATIMNPSYNKFIFDSSTNRYYLNYYKAFDKGLEDEIIKEGPDWMMKNSANYNRQRLAAFDESFNKIYEVAIDRPIGSMQLSHGNKLFHTIIGCEDESNESFLILEVHNNE